MFSFIITTNIQNETQYRQLVRCICSIRKYHLNKIYLINDNVNSKYNHLIYRLQFIYKNIHYYNSIIENHGECLVPKYINDILENDIDDEIENVTHFVYLHDTMLLNKKLENVNQINDIQFLLHMTNHRKHYDIDIFSELNQQVYNENNIKSMSDLILYIVKNNFTDQNFINYVIEAEMNKDLYVANFGLCYIVSKQFFKEFSNKFKKYNQSKFEDIMIDEDNYNKFGKYIKVSYECIFSLLLHYYYPNINYTNSLDGLYYDGIKVNPNAFKNFEYDNELLYIWKGEYISKLILK